MIQVASDGAHAINVGAQFTIREDGKIVAGLLLSNGISLGEALKLMPFSLLWITPWLIGYLIEAPRSRLLLLDTFRKYATGQ